jgi:hypothetical protein
VVAYSKSANEFYDDVTNLHRLQITCYVKGNQRHHLTLHTSLLSVIFFTQYSTGVINTSIGNRAALAIIKQLDPVEISTT